MEPLDDKELSGLLRKWAAPDAPLSLKRRVMLQPASGWRWLFKGSIRVPVPVGIAAVLVLVLWMAFWRTPPAPVVEPAPSSTLADFQPVEQLEPTIIERNDENQYK